ncbi:DUF1835 domain-containing protein [Marinicella litoralis]|uniref:Uncharacterized protein DUF1835 n=1 Tax=Marinicella litoralis TaxID=644220 RepID=A0A4V3DHI5_9GAMM|nr:DUF1835 domain-containing protein [Marinicella litoralis]TDR18361.1 uncharacterized protein DUF1835 [Marinicella litoralis]
MKSTLHITNGDAAVNAMKEAGITGDFLPWRDALHIGPVPSDQTPPVLDQIRINFMVESGWGSRISITKKFSDRKVVMDQLVDYQKIYLWFEHDLYDQLQLLQVLHWIELVPNAIDRVNLIVTDLYLGSASDDELHDLFRFSEPLTDPHMQTAQQYWLAFTSSQPHWLTSVEPSELFPFMSDAFNRLCLEYPSVCNGLNFVQTAVLQLLSKPMNGASLFACYQTTEEAPFLGDMIFWQFVETMCNSKNPLVYILNDEEDIAMDKKIFSRTSLGSEVLNHQKHLLSNGWQDCWIGGVQLIKRCIWCYDTEENQFKLWEGQ